MRRSSIPWVGGYIPGMAGTALIGATQAPVKPLRPVTMTLHHFGIAPGRETTFAEWFAFLHAHHSDRVASLSRARIHFKAMITAMDEPRRFYRIEVQGA